MMKIKHTLATLRDILLWFVRDHNGKPSSTRLIMLVITFKALQWGDYLVFYTDQGITDNLLYLIGVCVLGTAFFMKMISPKYFIQGLIGIFSKNNPQQESYTFSASNQAANWWKGGTVPTEQEIEDDLKGPGQ